MGGWGLMGVGLFWGILYLVGSGRTWCLVWCLVWCCGLVE